MATLKKSTQRKVHKEKKKSSVFSLEEYYVAIQRVEDTNSFFIDLFNKITSQNSHIEEALASGRDISKLLRQFASQIASMDDSSAMEEWLLTIADCCTIIQDLLAQLSRATVQAFGNSFYDTFKEKIQNARQMKRRFVKAREKYDGVSSNLKHETSVSKSQLNVNKLLQAEEQANRLRHEIAELGEQSVGLLLCTNEVLESDLMEKLCDYLEAYGGFFERGSTEFAQYREFVREHRSMCVQKKTTAMMLMGELSEPGTSSSTSGSSTATSSSTAAGSPPIHIATSAPLPSMSPMRSRAHEERKDASPNALRALTESLAVKMHLKGDKDGEKDKKDKKDKDKDKEKDSEKDKPSPRGKVVPLSMTAPEPGSGRSSRKKERPDDSSTSHKEKEKEKDSKEKHKKDKTPRSGTTTPAESPRGPRIRKPLDAVLVSADENERERAMLADLQAQVRTLEAFAGPEFIEPGAAAPFAHSAAPLAPKSPKASPHPSPGPSPRAAKVPTIAIPPLPSSSLETRLGFHSAPASAANSNRSSATAGQLMMTPRGESMLSPRGEELITPRLRKLISEKIGGTDTVGPLRIRKKGAKTIPAHQQPGILSALAATSSSEDSSAAAPASPEPPTLLTHHVPLSQSKSDQIEEITKMLKRSTHVYKVEKITKVKKTSSRVLKLNTQEITISKKDKAGKKRKVRPLTDLVQCVKSYKYPRKLKLFWQGMIKPQKFLFPSAEQRERFHEILFAFSFHPECELRTPRGNKPSGAHKGPQSLTTRTEDLSIFIGSWNMGNAPPSGSLAAWIPRKLYDIYAIGVQEAQWDSKSGAGGNEAEWFSALQEHLGEDFVRVVAFSLWHMRMYVAVRRVHCHAISNIEKSTEATGVAKVAGNKGGIAVAMQIYESRLCFVASHLAAHQEKVEERNAMYRQIVKGLAGFGLEGFDITNQYHFLFWFGDLNYRIELPREKVLDCIQNKRSAEMLPNDQLLNARQQQECFLGFEEAPITFPPTYKFVRAAPLNAPAAERYDSLRIPAWCDRILVKTLPQMNTQCRSLLYGSCEALTSSDHCPIFAVFRLSVHLHNVPHPKEPCFIAISQLQALNLRGKLGSGKADVYITFHAPFINGAPSTSVTSKTLNPSWDDESVPTLIPFSTNREFLEGQHLLCAVKDAVHGDLGQTAVSLRGAYTAEPVSFEVPITRKGKPSGLLRGKIHIVPSPI